MRPSAPRPRPSTSRSGNGVDGIAYRGCSGGKRRSTEHVRRPRPARSASWRRVWLVRSEGGQISTLANVGFTSPHLLRAVVGRMRGDEAKPGHATVSDPAEVHIARSASRLMPRLECIDYTDPLLPVMTGRYAASVTTMFDFPKDGWNTLVDDVTIPWRARNQPAGANPAVLFRRSEYARFTRTAYWPYEISTANEAVARDAVDGVYLWRQPDVAALESTQVELVLDDDVNVADLNLGSGRVDRDESEVVAPERGGSAAGRQVVEVNRPPIIDSFGEVVAADHAVADQLGVTIASLSIRLRRRPDVRPADSREPVHRTAATGLHRASWLRCWRSRPGLVGPWPQDRLRWSELRKRVEKDHLDSKIVTPIRCR